MQDMKIHREKLLADAAECELISGLATDAAKRELFARLAQRLKMLADEIDRSMATRGENTHHS
jgi:hypothetical protein